MKERTAMQQLLVKFQHGCWYSFDEIEQEILDFGLHKEKEQIDQAFTYALRMRFGSESQINSGKEYFDEKYSGK